MRVPQAGVLHEPTEAHPHASSDHGPVRNTFRKTHRWDRILRDQDELALLNREDTMLHVLFSSIPDDMGLYDKPMARNVQLWTTDDYQLLLDGPRAGGREIHKALEKIMSGGLYGYRFLFPAMRVGRYEVYWQRPLAAYHCDQTDKTIVLPEAPTGYFTAYTFRSPKLTQPIELWPRFLDRPAARQALSLPTGNHHAAAVHQLALNVRKLLEAFALHGHQPLPRSLARQLIHLPREQKLADWLQALPDEALKAEVLALLEPTATIARAGQGAIGGLPAGNVGGDGKGEKTAGGAGASIPSAPESLTFARTAGRAFEVSYWKTIAALAEGKFLNKNNADCVRDHRTQAALSLPDRQLDVLGDYLLAYYRRRISAAGLKKHAVAGTIPFRWQTDFDYSWMEGWLRNQQGATERDLLVMIPGRDRRRAVIIADHYDTAYMEDRFAGEGGARVAACGADDNHSATAALMLAAPIFLAKSRNGRLGCDVWLVHLTGEEFPADCLGARALVQRLVEGTLEVELQNGKTRDLSQVHIDGVFVSDMIAHNNHRQADVFQIAHGTGPGSFRLAGFAHRAAKLWNDSVPIWNERPDRAGQPPGRRSPHGAVIPAIAPHRALSGEIRPPYDPKSTLYNTDGQIFSDAGIPVVLFMENYDINRRGYHDTQDTMANIDLDYGAALAAIVIESVAQAAAAEK